MLGGEAHVGAGERAQALAELPAGLHRGGHLAPEPLEAVQRERVEQRLLVGEVPARGGVADADLARQLAQRQLAAAGERALGRAPAAPGGGSRGGRGGRSRSRREAYRLELTVTALLSLTSLYPPTTLDAMSTSKWTPKDLPNLDGRTVLITGATSGIGRAAATELARAGARVVLAVRNTRARRQIASALGNGAEARKLDLTDLASVRAFAEGWDGPIDVLINNAGVMAVPEGRTKDGFETQIGTNHLGHFALTGLLLEPRRATASCRSPPARTGWARSTSRTSTGSGAPTSAGPPTASPSSPTCCSCSSSSAGSPRPARRSARSPRTPATPRPSCRAAPATRSRTA